MIDVVCVHVQAKLSRLEVRAAVVDSQLMAASVRSAQQPQAPAANTSCAFGLMPEAPNSPFVHAPHPGQEFDCRGGLKEQNDLEFFCDAPPPFNSNQSSGFHVGSACVDPFQSQDIGGVAAPTHSMPLPARGCGLGQPNAAAGPVPTDASQLPMYLQSTLNTLQSFMVELQAASDGPVRPCVLEV